MYLLILFFLAPADRWMDDKSRSGKTPEDNYYIFYNDMLFTIQCLVN